MKDRPVADSPPGGGTTTLVEPGAGGAGAGPHGRGPHALQAVGDDPPVVARLIVEIRSDGTRTVARGAVEDVLTGERVAIEARGTTPLQLAGALAKNLATAPLLARHMMGGLMARGERRLRGLLLGRGSRGE